jgi:S-formylglutathione hydrolase FrmB
MAIATLNLYSESLGTQQDVTVILPKPEDTCRSAVLYLLHGLLDGQHSWLQRSRIAEYAEQYCLIIVMPNAQRSFYTNQKNGYAWRDWIETELPAAIEQWFGLTDPVSRHVAGLSMGGYGAMKLGLSSPKRFQSIGSFSGVLHLSAITHYPELNQIMNDIELAFGGVDNIAGSKDDLTTLIHKTPMPFMHITCGLQDSLLEGNRYLAKVLVDQEANVLYQEVDGGHEWKVWDKNIEDYLVELARRGLISRI